ncbi:MAG: ATP-binding protein [Methanomicrobiales archaeon]|nr:ATP-binding protein [Methanomicrobiales archaeon]
MKDNFCIFCCENIRPEVDAILATGSLPRATVRSFPLHCGHVTSVWKTVSDQYHELEEAGAQVCLCGCGCSNTLDIPKEVLIGPSLIFHAAGASMFLPEELINNYQKNGALVVLPGWLSRWKQNASCDKLDQATARQMYAESIREIILLDTGTHPGTVGILKEFAEFIGVPSLVLPVGTGYCRLRLTELYLTWQCEQEAIGCRTEVHALEKKVADYSMVSDLTTKIIGAHDEKTVILQMLDLFFLLCSPKKAEFLPFRDGVYGDDICIPQSADNQGLGQVPFPDLSVQYLIANTGDGFRFRVMHDQQLLGILSIDGLSLPGYLDEYLNLTHFISQVAGLSITIARTYGDLERAVAEREAEIVDRRRAEEALRQANKKLNLLSSITRHDINNQLTVQMGYLSILEKKLPDSTYNEYFQKVSTATKRISAMVRFTKEYEEIGVHAPTWQDCRTLVDTAAMHSPPGIVKVKNDFPAGTEVLADPLVIKVFYNLMDNATRYVGKITTIRFTALESGDDHLIVCEDDGDGIVAAEKEKIFVRGFGKNTGLGLALSREILDITGITIKETGEPGKGARFEMTVPDGAWRMVGKGA